MFSRDLIAESAYGVALLVLREQAKSGSCGAGNRPGRFRRRRNATEWEQGPGRERKPRVGKEEGLRFRGADYEICRWRYFLNVKKVTKEHRGRSVRLKNHDFKFRIKS